MVDAATVTWSVHIDFDCADWQGTHDFTTSGDDISAYIAGVTIYRGKEIEAGNSPAGTCELAIKPGNCALFSPENEESAYYGKLRPWLPVRVRAYYNSTYYSIFYGYISRIAINPHLDSQTVYIYVTDGMDLLARQAITQDYDNRTTMSDGAAISAVLNAAGWPAGKRSIDTSGGSDLFSYPQTGVY